MGGDAVTGHADPFPSGAGRFVDLGGGGEFDLIRRFVAQQGPLSPGVLVGPGDDAAVLGGGTVVSTDLSVEDVHFRRAWITDQEVGYRAAAAALSDLAAMAAEPVGLLMSLALPRGGAIDAEAVHAGVLEMASSVGATVLGGDVSRSPGPLVLDVTVVGCASWPVLRTGALPGDEVWVTGSLGGAAAAVEAWEAGGVPGPPLRHAFARPTPRLRQACCLAEREMLHALIDVSDGLAGDAGHLAAASGVRIVLEAPLIPVAPDLTDRPDRGLSLALRGGEDYELCFAAPAGRIDDAEFTARFGLRLTRVGRVEHGTGVWLEAGGTVEPLATGGFDHLELPE